MSHTAHLVRLVTTASITIVFHVFVQEVTSVLKRPRSPSHAGREHITLINALRKPLTVVLAQLALLVIREVLMITYATCVQQDTTVLKLVQKKILFLAQLELLETRLVQSLKISAGSAHQVSSAKEDQATQLLVTLVTCALLALQNK